MSADDRDTDKDRDSDRSSDTRDTDGGSDTRGTGTSDTERSDTTGEGTARSGRADPVARGSRTTGSDPADGDPAAGDSAGSDSGESDATGVRAERDRTHRTAGTGPDDGAGSRTHSPRGAHESDEVAATATGGAAKHAAVSGTPAVDRSENLTTAGVGGHRETVEHAMVERGEAPNVAHAVKRRARDPLLWGGPIVVVSIVMSLLAGLYLASIVKPEDHLNHFPVAIVNQDTGDVLPGDDQPSNIGDQVTQGILAGIDPDEIDMQEMGIAAATQALDDAQIYGAIIIPSDFTKRTSILAQASLVPGDVERPIITILSNARAGTIPKGIVGEIANRAMSQVNDTIGTQLTDKINETIANDAPDLSLSGGAALTLAQPIEVREIDHNPLPDGSGLGLTAFYYALLLVLAGFTGATIVNTMVDGTLGFIPFELGPRFIDRGRTVLTRLQVLLVKWGIITVLGLVVAGLYVLIGHLVGMYNPNPFLLWMYSAFAIIAVGITSLSMMSIFGSVGLLFNLILFIVLGLPSSGGTVPLEAMPGFFAWLAQFEPMHQIFVAVRAIMYFDGRGDAGLIHGTTVTLIGLVIGVAIGIVFAIVYEKRGFPRRVDQPGVTVR